MVGCDCDVYSRLPGATLSPRCNCNWYNWYLIDTVWQDSYPVLARPSLVWPVTISAAGSHVPQQEHKRSPSTPQNPPKSQTVILDVCSCRWSSRVVLTLLEILGNFFLDFSKHCIVSFLNLEIKQKRVFQVVGRVFAWDSYPGCWMLHRDTHSMVCHKESLVGRAVI